MRDTNASMTDSATRRAWWPDLYTVCVELRAIGRHDIADELDRSVAGSATSGELLGNIGLVLRTQDVQRSRLTQDGRRAWDAIMHDVNQDAPLRRAAYRWRRLFWP
ncbi:MAG: hypothetical protein FJ363_03430 [Gemmatimonadetes bacterium]|nr:hypothetical protein [Gemmatimonadota bacterium]